MARKEGGGGFGNVQPETFVEEQQQQEEEEYQSILTPNGWIAFYSFCIFFVLSFLTAKMKEETRLRRTKAAKKL